MSPLSIDIIGYTAGVLIAASLMPQVLKSWKTKSTKDISIAWTLIYLSGILLWVFYGYLLHAWPIFCMAIVEASMALSLLVLKARYG